MPEPFEGAEPYVTLGPVQGASSLASEPTETWAKTRPNFALAESSKMDNVGHEPMPRKAYELIPPVVHDTVRGSLSLYKGLWNGQVVRLDITPYRITLT